MAKIMNYSVSAVHLKPISKPWLERSTSSRNLLPTESNQPVASGLDQSQGLETPLVDVVEDGLKLAAEQDADMWEHLQISSEKAGIISNVLEALVALVNAHAHLVKYKEASLNAIPANLAGKRDAEYKSAAKFYNVGSAFMGTVQRDALENTMRRLRHQAVALNAYAKYENAKAHGLPLPAVPENQLALAQYLIDTQFNSAKHHAVKAVSSSLAAIGAVSGVVALACPVVGIVAAVALGLSSAMSFYSPYNDIGKVYFGRFRTPKRKRYEEVLHFLSLTAFADKADLKNLSTEIKQAGEAGLSPLKTRLQEEFNRHVGDHLIRLFINLPDHAEVNNYINPEDREAVLGMATDAVHPEASAYFRKEPMQSHGFFKRMIMGPGVENYQPAASVS